MFWFIPWEIYIPTTTPPFSQGYNYGIEPRSNWCNANSWSLKKKFPSKQKHLDWNKLLRIKEKAFFKKNIEKGYRTFSVYIYIFKPLLPDSFLQLFKSLYGVWCSQCKMGFLHTKVYS